jgi:hypothetical protein
MGEPRFDAEITYAEITTDGMVRQPSFKALLPYPFGTRWSISELTTRIGGLHPSGMCGRVIKSSGPLRYAIVDGVRETAFTNTCPGRMDLSGANFGSDILTIQHDL